MIRKILIIEDEPLNAQRLTHLLEKIGNYEISPFLQSVASSIEWFTKEEMPDCIFMDIQLLDGQAFEIFAKVEITCPVIFVTAYDQFAIKAFEVNAIDYLLKPIALEKLENAIEKANRLQFSENEQNVYQQLLQMSSKQIHFRQRFLVAFRGTFIPISTDKIQYFYSENKITHLVTKDSQDFMIDFTLEKLDEELDPDSFKRITRQMIVHVNAIDHIYPLFNGQIGIELIPHFKDSIQLSREKSSELKVWLNR